MTSIKIEQQVEFAVKTGFGQVRLARPADGPAILDMVAALAAFNGDQSGLTAEFLAREAFGAAPLLQVLVAEEGADLIGYAALISVAQMHFGRRGCDLHHLYAAPTRRGQGIGRALVQAVISRAKDQGCAYLKVSTDVENLKAQAFYHAVGFEPRVSLPPQFSMELG